MELSLTPGNSGRRTCSLLDKEVGFQCLASLLGVGRGRLSTSAAPDLRYGKREYKSKPGTWTVDGFFQVCYDSIAETLPDEFLERLPEPCLFMGSKIQPNKGVVVRNILLLKVK